MRHVRGQREQRESDFEIVREQAISRVLISQQKCFVTVSLLTMLIASGYWSLRELFPGLYAGAL
jgi:hypothetical protein